MISSSYLHFLFILSIPSLSIFQLTFLSPIPVSFPPWSPPTFPLPMCPLPSFLSSFLSSSFSSACLRVQSSSNIACKLLLKWNLFNAVLTRLIGPLSNFCHHLRNSASLFILTIWGLLLCRFNQVDQRQISRHWMWEKETVPETCRSLDNCRRLRILSLADSRKAPINVKKMGTRWFKWWTPRRLSTGSNTKRQQ